MSNREFYQETFSQVRGTGEIRWEDYEMRRRGKSLKWFVTLAASVALLAALSALAVAAARVWVAVTAWMGAVHGG